MRQGRFEEGEATLRLKQDVTSSNPRMWDLVAYRIIKRVPHVRTQYAWCIYPSYDFTHCICDSLENITHSLCTLEFIGAREPYYWILDKLGIYKPVQWEYGRLAITNTVLSKRKITKLVSLGLVSGWDDPRLFTLAAIRRRGFSKNAVNEFVEKLGITTCFTVTDVRLLEATVRDDLNKTAPRRMAVLNPLKVIIDNMSSEEEEMIALTDMLPGNEEQIVSQLPFTKEIYIDSSDFLDINPEDPSKPSDKSLDSFFRLTPNQPVGLYKVGIISVTSIQRDLLTGKPICLLVNLDRQCDAAQATTSHPVKAYIQWVAKSKRLQSPVPIQARLYKSLFLSESPDSHPDGFLADINPHSLDVVDGFVDIRCSEATTEQVFQFQRLGYFCVDPDSKLGMLVFNKTVSLREDALKKI